MANKAFQPGHRIKVGANMSKEVHLGGLAMIDPCMQAIRTLDIKQLKIIDSRAPSSINRAVPCFESVPDVLPA